MVLRDVWKTYQTGAVALTALRGISLSIERGEFAAIMGPSGSGKSTLMNVIGCLDQKDQGSYELNGQSIGELSPNELARIRNEEIGFIFQSFNLLSKLNLRENVELPMVYAGIPRRERTEKAMAALDSVGLADWARHKPNEISGGQKQRVAIARAVVLKPAILMADEPTGNLDSKSSSEIMKLFRQLHRNGATIILITHDAHIAASAQRILTVSDGQIIADSKGINAPVSNEEAAYVY
jgi:putative ABC transport system ATP-binding protein